MKKLLSAVIALSLLLSLTVFGGTAAFAADEKPYDGVTITFYSPPYTPDGSDVQWYDELFAPFEEETGIHVETTVVDWDDIETKEQTEWMSGGGPDVMFGSGAHWPFADEGLIYELSELYSEEELEDYKYLDYTSWMGKNYYLPYTGASEWRFLAVNLDIMEAAGVEVPDGDWTWEDLVAAAQKVQEYDSSIYPFMTPLGGNANNRLYNHNAFLYQSGGEFFDYDTGEWQLATEAGVEAFQFIYDLGNTYGILSQDCLTLGDEEVFSLFLEKKAAIILADVFLDMKSIDFNWEAYNMIHKAHGFFNCVDCIAINKNSENPEAAAKVAAYLTSTETAQKMRDTGFYYNGEMRKSDHGYEVPFPQLEDVAACDNQFYQALVPGWECMGSDLGTLQQQVFLGEITPEEAAEKINTLCQDAYDEFFE